MFSGGGVTSTPQFSIGTGFGTTTQSTTTAASLFPQIGAPAATTSQFSFGAPTQSTTQQGGTGVAFGTTTTTSSLFGQSAAPLATSTPSFSFGNPSSIASTQAQATPAFSFGTKPATTTPGLTTFGTTSASPFGLTSKPATTAASIFNLGQAKPPSTTSSMFGFTTTSTTAGGVAVSQPTTAATLSTATTTTSSNSMKMSQLNFTQIQDLIHKWTVELSEQEKLFINEATRVNSWDKTLLANGDKISKLSEAVAKVKVEHNNLDYNLMFLKNQQLEMENILSEIEKNIPVEATVDPEREHLYSLAENVDTQLQQMAEDLKEVIHHINNSNKTLDNADPIYQILKTLNEHTDALQWVEDNTVHIKKTLDEVSNMHQNFRKDHERNVRFMIN